jgi:hypothetical protein
MEKSGESSVVVWLRGAKMSEVLLNLAKEVCNVLESTEKQKSIAWSILKLCFSPCAQGERGKKNIGNHLKHFVIIVLFLEMFANFSTVSAIMLMFCEALAIPKTALDDRATLESYSNFIGELTGSLFSQRFKLCEKTLQELLFGTFKLCCSPVGLSQSAHASLQNALVNGVLHLKNCGVNMTQLINKFASAARQEFSFLNLKPVSCMGKLLAVLESEEALDLFLKHQDKYETWRTQIEDACVLNEIVLGGYWPPDKKIPIATSIDCIFELTVETLLRANLLLELVGYIDKEIQEEGEEESALAENYSNVIAKEAEKVLRSYVICDKAISSYKNVNVKSNFVIMNSI